MTLPSTAMKRKDHGRVRPKTFKAFRCRGCGYVADNNPTEDPFGHGKCPRCGSDQPFREVRIRD